MPYRGYLWGGHRDVTPETPPVLCQGSGPARLPTHCCKAGASSGSPHSASGPGHLQTRALCEKGNSPWVSPVQIPRRWPVTETWPRICAVGTPDECPSRTRRPDPKQAMESRSQGKARRTDSGSSSVNPLVSLLAVTVRTDSCHGHADFFSANRCSTEAEKPRTPHPFSPVEQSYSSQKRSHLSGTRMRAKPTPPRARPGARALLPHPPTQPLLPKARGCVKQPWDMWAREGLATPTPPGVRDEGLAVHLLPPLPCPLPHPARLHSALHMQCPQSPVPAAPAPPSSSGAVSDKGDPAVPRRVFPGLRDAWQPLQPSPHPRRRSTWPMAEQGPGTQVGLYWEH